MNGSAAPVDIATLGGRLRYVRSHSSQKAFAESLGVALGTYQNYERDERIPDSEFIRRLVDQGWSANWLVSGIQPLRIDQLVGIAEDRANYTSQPVKHETLTIALQLASEALEGQGRTLPPAKRAELVSALYELLEEGLPEAKVLRFARAAAA